MEDEKILELFQNREEKAIQAVQEKYGAKLKRFAMQFLGNEADAEECLNDVYFKAWKALPEQKPEYLSAYLMQICRYTAFDMIDRKNAQKRNAVITELTAEMEQCLPDCTAVQETELSEILNTFLKHLPKEKRLLFIRRYWYGDSVKELAEMFHFRESKVKTTLFRIRKKLEKVLQERGVFHERKNITAIHDGD